ncbi:MAG: hypothetical protein ACRDSH_16435 [Pseudonocardiaceae bacterium]
MKLRNIGREAVSLYRAEGLPGAITVEPDGIVEVAGESIQVDGQSDYLLTIDATTGEHRAWSRSRLELVTDAASVPATESQFSTPLPAAPSTTTGQVTDAPASEG